jgi:hypothetical protein
MQTAMDINWKAMELLLESMDNMKGAQTEVLCSHNHMNDLLSVSSCHPECTRASQCIEEDGMDQLAMKAKEQHHREAEYECRLQSNILTMKECEELRPSIISLWLMGSDIPALSVSRCTEGNIGSQDLRGLVSVPRGTPHQSPVPKDHHHSSVHDWI